VTQALRVYQLNLYGRARGVAGRKAPAQYVLVASDDATAFQVAAALHGKIITRAAFAELINDQGGQAVSWAGGVVQGPQSPASAKAESRSGSPADIQWGGSKASHWAQTRSFMFRIVRVASISGR
jgi:hypothetical protein